MTKKFPYLFLIIIFLVSCGPVTPVIPEATPEPIIKFLPPNFLLGNANDYGVYLSVGIFAINKDIAFLLGGIGEPSSGQQSTLLRSEDGGRHWLEVMNPQKGSSVVDFQMLETGEGWALVMWTVEGPGTPILFHTTDNGLTWTKLSEVPKPDGFGVPAGMIFFDHKNGQMIMSVVGGLHDRLAFITTTDGGLSWKETGSYIPPFDDYRLRASAITELYTANLKNFTQSTSLDNSSQWKVELVDKSIIIYRQLFENYSWSKWEILSTLPQHFDYKDGQIIVP